MIREALADLSVGRSLGFDRAHDAMGDIMDGLATPAQVGAFLMGLRMKGEGPDEIAGMAIAMRERAASIRAPDGGRVVDLCGTGGAALPTFNVSTIAMFVVSAAGVRVAKHGNRAVTSRCGSADLLEALGARVDLAPPEVERILGASGLAFLFAPTFHPAMRHAVGPRKDLGLRTVFNILGPLTNPAGARGHLLGVFSPDLVPLLSKVCARLGIDHALIVHGQAGMDEICLCCPTIVGEVADGLSTQFMLTPEHLGFERVGPEALAGADPEASAAEAVRILRGARGPKRDMVLANAAAGIYVGGKARSIQEAIPLAAEAVDSGKAFERLRRFIADTGGDVSRVDGDGRA
ncbi:MAG TPA: anthranilate phosphoribosyltransferase [Thermoplasmata archaeon]|nr:anthranilate phosphoribosyltransferase [Thermoplasmata archaeon]